MAENEQTPEQQNTSEQMLIDMSNQMKEKFEENERVMEGLRRDKFNNEVEMFSWFGLISALDTLLAESGCPPEIQTISEVLNNKAEEWIKLRLGEVGCPKIFLSRPIDLNIEVITPENNNNTE